MDIYHLSQEQWDAFNKSMSDIMDIEYKPSEKPSDDIIELIGNNFSRKGYPHTEESKKLMSENSKGQAAWNKGKKTGPLSEEQKKKLSIALKGKPTWNKGIPATDETKEKCRQASLNYNAMTDPNRAPELKKKISEKLKGRVFTEEWRKKLSEAAKKRVRKKA
jgi:hypothetical protein